MNAYQQRSYGLPLTLGNTVDPATLQQQAQAADQVMSLFEDRRIQVSMGMGFVAGSAMGFLAGTLAGFILWKAFGKETGK